MIKYTGYRHNMFSKPLYDLNLPLRLDICIFCIAKRTWIYTMEQSAYPINYFAHQTVPSLSFGILVSELAVSHMMNGIGETELIL